MGRELPIERDDATRWSVSQGAFNAWRGACLHTFTSVEAEMSEAVLRLATRQPATIVPHLAGQRTAIVLSAASSSGAHPEPHLVDVLETFHRHDALRTALCHGKATLTLDRADRWTAVLRAVVFRRNVAERIVTVVEEGEAEAIARALQRDGNRVVQRLRTWCVE